MDRNITTVDMDTEKNIPAIDAYVQSIKDFTKYAAGLIPTDANGTEEQRAAYDSDLLKLYEMPWTISFGGKTITIENEAHIHVGMVELLEDFIEKCL